MTTDLLFILWQFSVRSFDRAEIFADLAISERCSRPLCSSQGTGGDLASRRVTRGEDPVRRCGVAAPSGPNSVPDDRSIQLTFHSGRAGCTCVRPDRDIHIDVPPMSNLPGAYGRGRLWTPSLRKARRQVLLRKEVIQPHLPVRLPCYDLVPIANPTFDGSLQKVGPPASGVTDFRDLTGGVYKARERIHRSVADLRLLATPTSWGRVADPNPN